MAKVVTSDGGIQSTEVIQDKKRPGREAAAPLEIVKTPAAVEIGENNNDAQVADVTKPVDPNDGLDPDDIVELAKAEAEKERKRIGKYVARLRAQEALAKTKETEAADSERFAEQLFNE